MKILTGIYKISSIIHPDREYIGSAKNIENRIGGHLRRLRRNKIIGGNNGVSRKLQAHFNKYGESDLCFNVVEELTFTTKEELLEREQYYLDTLNPWFNICKKANSCLGVKRTKAQREAIGRSSKGRNAGIKRKPFSEETISKMKEARNKRPLPSEETRKRISESCKGQKRSAEFCKKMSEKRKIQTPPMLGRRHSDETKKKMAEKAKGRKPWLGRHHTEETKQKISVAIKKYLNKKNDVA